MVSDYEKMEQFVYDNDILLLYGRLPNDMSGFYYQNSNCGIKSITLSTKLDTTAKRICVLAEELEHYVTTPVDLFYATKYLRDKLENIARFNAVKKLMPFNKLIDARRRSCDIYELADELNVTVEFLVYGLAAYKEHYGLTVSYKDFIISFDPFKVDKACRF
jgi:Zn-dependent peptidase ImmA (M78 family)